MGSIVSFTFEYGQKLTDTQVGMFSAVTGKNRVELTDGEAEEVKGVKTYSAKCWQSFEGDIDEVIKIGVPVVVKSKLDMDIFSYQRLYSYFINMNERLRHIETMVKEVYENEINVESQQFNAKVKVHLPGNQLMDVKRVLLLEDSCTDLLKNHIEEGWRILAICPQPNQRRPDYILGRNDLEDDNL